MGQYVYIKSEPNLWTVGFYDPQGEWHLESDWDNGYSAASRVIELNGGKEQGEIIELLKRIDKRAYNLEDAHDIVLKHPELRGRP